MVIRYASFLRCRKSLITHIQPKTRKNEICSLQMFFNLPAIVIFNRAPRHSLNIFWMMWCVLAIRILIWFQLSFSMDLATFQTFATLFRHFLLSLWDVINCPCYWFHTTKTASETIDRSYIIGFETRWYYNAITASLCYGGQESRNCGNCVLAHTVASLINEVNPRLAKQPLKTNGRLPNRGLTSLVIRLPTRAPVRKTQYT